jgi:hypothetical protein
MKHTCFIIGMFTLAACSRVGEAIESGAEQAGKAAGNLAQRVSSGVEQALEIKPDVSTDLTRSGLQTGKVLIGNEGEGTDNKLSVYFIAGKHIDASITARVTDVQNREIGRAVSRLQIDSGQARYLDFIFDRYTNIDGNSRVFLGFQ